MRAIRLEMGLSQEDFGERFGYNRTYVGGIERGERNITLKTLERVSAQLGVRPFDLLWDADDVGIRIDPGDPEGEPPGAS